MGYILLTDLLNLNGEIKEHIENWNKFACEMISNLDQKDPPTSCLSLKDRLICESMILVEKDRNPAHARSKLMHALKPAHADIVRKVKKAKKIA